MPYYEAVSVFYTVDVSSAGVFFGNKVGELVGWVGGWVDGWAEAHRYGFL